MKKLHFVSGMPRAGTRLLMNILAQNPRFYPGVPSGLLELLFNIRNGWETIPEHQTMEWELSDARKEDVMRSLMLDTYWQRVEQDVVFDFSRGWLAYMEMTELLLGEKAKVLVCVRDLREILASFEMLWRKTSSLRQMYQERDYYTQMQDIPGRCKTWMRPAEPVGLAFRRVQDVVMRGFEDRICFVHYERLTADPEATMAEIYNFLEEETFDHDFNNVEQVTQENDRIHNIPGLHKIRPKIEPQRPKRFVLGSIADKYFWSYPWDAKAKGE